MQDYLCPVQSVFAAIHAKPPTRKDRFMILSPRGDVGRYVQCLLHDDDTAFYCEATSGALQRAGQVSLSDAGRARLAELGFGGDPAKENYQIDIPNTGPETAAQVSRLLLETLWDVYRVRGSDTLMVDAPFFAKGKKRPLDRHERACAAIS